MIEQLGRSSCRIYQADGVARVIRPNNDARAAMLTGSPPRRATHVPITSIMTRDVICAQRTLGVDMLVQLMVRHHIGAIPIVSERGKPLGMVTKLDLVEQLAGLSNRTAEDVMMPLAMTLDEYATVADASAMMAIEWVHHVPVVSAAGTVMGMVSSLDIVRWLSANEQVAADDYVDGDAIAQDLPLRSRRDQ